MDFMKMLRSLEELLYEVMTWLVFYPRTLILTLIKPLKTLEYSRAQIHRSEEEQFDSTLSPPLFLLLSLLLSHGIEVGLHFDPFGGVNNTLTRLSEQNLLVFRALVFAVFPLMFALHHLKATKLSLTRITLRGPFFIECYPAAVFALILGAGFTIASAVPKMHEIGLAIAAVATVWYLSVQTAWISRHGMSWPRALVVAVWQFGKATAVILAFAFVLHAGSSRTCW